jgi:hypothetical protein
MTASAPISTPSAPGVTHSPGSRCATSPPTTANSPSRSQSTTATSARPALSTEAPSPRWSTTSARIATIGLDQGALVATSDLPIHYLAASKTSPFAVGTTVKRGQRSVVVRVDVHDGSEGRLGATSTIQFSVIRPRALLSLTARHFAFLRRDTTSPWSS